MYIVVQVKMFIDMFTPEGTKCEIWPEFYPFKIKTSY